MIKVMVVEDNEKLRPALVRGLEETGEVSVIFSCAAGEKAVEECHTIEPEAVLMDVQLAGKLNGIETAVALRREIPRLPVVFYSIQDDDGYFRDFRNSGILSHYAYVKKSNYLLPGMILPLLKDALGGRSFIDPEIEVRVQEVRRKDNRSPMEMLEPNERTVANMLALGLGNEQIAARMGLREKRTVARINGQIYATWGLNESATDEKVARTRAALIVRQNRMIIWDDDGTPQIEDAAGDWIEWTPA